MFSWKSLIMWSVIGSNLLTTWTSWCVRMIQPGVYGPTEMTTTDTLVVLVMYSVTYGLSGVYIYNKARELHLSATTIIYELLAGIAIVFACGVVSLMFDPFVGVRFATGLFCCLCIYGIIYLWKHAKEESS